MRHHAVPVAQDDAFFSRHKITLPLTRAALSTTGPVLLVHNTSINYIFKHRTQARTYGSKNSQAIRFEQESNVS